jgi:sugar phosphate isomerase/epimerase
MKLGMLTVMMADQPLEDVLDLMADYKMESVEFYSGPMFSNSHCNPEELLGDDSKVKKLKKMVKDRDMIISALSCHCNPLHPDPEIGPVHAKSIRDSILVAEKLDVDSIITFSGCPEGAEGDKTPNWVHEPWPDWFPEILEWQWEEKLIPFWTEMAAFAREHNVKHICFELHPGDMLYNPETLFRLREAVGEEICCNYDMSNLEWMGMDTLEVILELGDTIKHVHAKDAKTYRRNAAINGTLDAKSLGDHVNRSWNFRTVGYGHGEEYWTQFLINLRMIGYDHVLSIEHEDGLMSPEEGLEKAVNYLNRIILREDPGPMHWV